MTSFPPPRPAKAVALTLKLKDSQEHLLRRLGQALVLQWEEIPPELQDVLIDQAVIVDDAKPTSQSELETFIRSVRSVAVSNDNGGQPK
jgi:hypothetical protein